LLGDLVQEVLGFGYIELGYFEVEVVRQRLIQADFHVQFLEVGLVGVFDVVQLEILVRVENVHVLTLPVRSHKILEFILVTDNLATIRITQRAQSQLELEFLVMGLIIQNDRIVPLGQTHHILYIQVLVVLICDLLRKMLFGAGLHYVGSVVGAIGVVNFVNYLLESEYEVF
jgi:hypothetical protein